MLTKEEILATKCKVEDVEIPEWGGLVRVRELTAHDRDVFEGEIFDADGRFTFADVRARLVARTVLDVDGNRLFRNEDVPALSNLGARTITRLFEVAQRLSGLTPADVEALTIPPKDGKQ